MEILHLAAGSGLEHDSIISIMWIAIAAFLAPILSEFTRGRIPAVVWMLILGLIIGPSVASLAQSDSSISMLRELGMGMLFLLAGWEIDPETLKGKQANLGVVTWLIALCIAIAGAFLIVGQGDVLKAIVVGIAVSSTALGTLLPVLKSQGETSTAVGRGVLVHGAIGELAPIFAMALLLSSRATWITVVVLLAFFVAALVIALVPRTIAAVLPWMARAVKNGSSHTNQTTMRGVVMLLTILMACAAVFELDVVLGAFAAGIILRALIPERARSRVEARLEVMGYGMLIPVFFVTSGMSISLETIIANPLLVLLGIVIIYVARGLPILLVELFLDTGSGITEVSDKVRLSLYAATGLPIIVAVTEVALSRNLIDAEQASLMVCAGALTVLLFPMLAALIGHRPLLHDVELGPVTPEDHQAAQAASEATKVARDTAPEGGIFAMGQVDQDVR